MKKKIDLTDFETVVREYLQSRRENDPRFSLRNQARRWNIPFSNVQKIATGERRLGLYTARALAPFFDIELIETKTLRRRVSKRQTFVPLNPESEAHVSWVNLAILEMIKLDDFKPSDAWVANRLGLDVSSVTKILREMEEQGLLLREKGSWRDLLGDAMIARTRFITTDTVRKSIKNLLEVSRHKVDSVPYERREHSFNLIPIDEKQLPRLKKKISNLRLEFTQETQNSKGPKTQIYSFQIGFFPVTK